jgi:hypothetical protein
MTGWLKIAAVLAAFGLLIWADESGLFDASPPRTVMIWDPLYQEFRCMSKGSEELLESKAPCSQPTRLKDRRPPR